MYQEKDTPPQTGVFKIVTQQMLDEYRKRETQPLSKAMLIVAVLFVLAIVTLKLWS